MFDYEDESEDEKQERQLKEDVSDAYDFIKKYYPGFWDRVTEDDLLHLLTLGHTLFKTNPQILEATTKIRKTPTQ
jgi:hypothetical protein